MYYVITCTPDGISVIKSTREELQHALTPDEQGHVVLNAAQALADIPDSDPNYWKGGFLIVKGKTIVPQGKMVVTRYEIE